MQIPKQEAPELYLQSQSHNHNILKSRRAVGRAGWAKQENPRIRFNTRHSLAQLLLLTESSSWVIIFILFIATFLYLVYLLRVCFCQDVA